MISARVIQFRTWLAGSYSGPDPYGVYIGGPKIGRDPDPNVRQELVYDWLYEHSW